MSKEYIHTPSPSTAFPPKDEIVAYVRRAPKGRAVQHHQSSVEAEGTPDQSYGQQDASAKKVFSTATS